MDTKTWRDFLRPDEAEALARLDGDAKSLGRERLKIRKRGWNRLIAARDREANHAAP